MSAPTASERGQYSVLVVCTANICRSPAATYLLERAVGFDGSVRVVSAGVRARAGAPFDTDMSAALGETLPAFRARQLTSAMVREFDLILTMASDHRSAVVSAVPSAIRRTFTLREFADLAALAGTGAGTGDADATVADTLSALAARTPQVRPLRSGRPDDIADPYGRGAAAYERAVADISAAVASLAAQMPRESRTGRMDPALASAQRDHSPLAVTRVPDLGRTERTQGRR